MSNNNDGFKTFVSFVLGAAVGAVCGLLLAPKPGKQLRDDLKEFTDKIADDARAEYEKASAKVREMGDKAKNIAEETKEKIRRSGKDTEPAG
ncbi:MAG: YtxH domain-containing protein [Spirochaetes bacterium]|nr:YtxH domain-containing protein [Spirochaetota bacterium]